MSKNMSELSFRKGLIDNLFDKMGQAAEKDGAPSSKDLEQLAEDFLIGKANTYGTTTFYDFLKPENKGKKVYVCNGTACVCAGTQEKLIDTLKEKFQPEEIGHMTCLGRCHENSAFHYNGKNYSAKKAEEVQNIIQGDTTDSNQDQYHVAANTALLTTPS